MTMRNPPKKILCSFCNRCPEDAPEGDVVIRSPIGGEPPVICSGCIRGYYLLITSRASVFEEAPRRP
jgi:hypothetical protein